MPSFSQSDTTNTQSCIQLLKKCFCNPVSQKLFYMFLFTFIVFAAICQGMPAVFQGGLETTNHKYRLYFNFLCPELRKLILGNGQNTRNIISATLGGFSFAGLALAGLKQMINESTSTEIRVAANWANKIYKFISCMPGAALTYEFLPATFESWPFSEIGVDQNKAEIIAICGASAVFTSNMIMYDAKILGLLGSQIRRLKAHVCSGGIVRKIIEPTIALGTFYFQGMRQAASLGKQLNKFTNNQVPYIMDPLAFGASLAFPSFIYEQTLAISTDLASSAMGRYVHAYVNNEPHRDLKRALKETITPWNLLKLLLSILIFLPLFAMTMDFMGEAIDMTYSERDSSRIITNTPLNLLHIQAPALQAACVLTYLATGIPETIKVLVNRICNCNQAPSQLNRADSQASISSEASRNTDSTILSLSRSGSQNSLLSTSSGERSNSSAVNLLDEPYDISSA